MTDSSVVTRRIAKALARCIPPIGGLIRQRDELLRKVGWHHRVLKKLTEAGFRIISNFARLLADEELVAMARISKIQISVGTHRKDVLRAIRRHADLGYILVNMREVKTQPGHGGTLVSAPAAAQSQLASPHA
jgi:hypothetical protein